MERIETLNYRLTRDFGYFDGNNPNYRIVWSHDQFEMRHGIYDKYSGAIWIGVEEGWKEVPKYRQYINPPKWILERCVPVPEANKDDLKTKYSYECIWAFQDKNEQPLPPKWEICLMVIGTIQENMALAGKGFVKYKDPLSDPKTARDVMKADLDKTYENLFGNETPIADALVHGYGVSVPRNYNGDSASVTEQSKDSEKHSEPS